MKRESSVILVSEATFLNNSLRVEVLVDEEKKITHLNILFSFLLVELVSYVSSGLLVR